jgi:sucrose phosphorylase
VGLARTGKLRSINREKLELLQLERELANKRTLRAQIYTGYSHMLAVRASQPAFNPYGTQEILSHDPSTFAVLRSSLDGRQRVLCVHDVSGQSKRYDAGPNFDPIQTVWDLLTEEKLSLDDLPLAPYQVRWLTFEEPRWRKA